ncbi:unnamed protein product [Brassicogethes aeneus]|uniref:F-box domain-containing protein n=1 Tax=Brassicogethes aeneus TaxID=1431903 RepID=A0A9P0ASC9_BRAAE|nr:unnamed protein product [Brassicogethes aeneus]
MFILSQNLNDFDEDEVPRKKIKLFNHIDIKCYINSLPDEIMTKIFSYIPNKFLYFQARAVCRKWKKITCAPELWKKIIAGKNITTQSLECWITMATHLTEINLKQRCDINYITQQLTKYSRNLVTLKIESCWGTEDSKYIKSSNLCKMVQHCC